MYRKLVQSSPGLTFDSFFFFFFNEPKLTETLQQLHILHTGEKYDKLMLSLIALEQWNI